MQNEAVHSKEGETNGDDQRFQEKERLQKYVESEPKEIYNQSASGNDRYFSGTTDVDTEFCF